MRDLPGHTRDLHPACFLILGLPVAVFLIHEQAVPLVGVPILPVTPEEILIEGLDFAEAAGRHRFLGALMFFTVLVMISLIAFAVELGRGLALRARLLALAVFAVTQVPVVMAVLSHHGGRTDDWRSYDQLGEGVLRAVLERGNVVLCEGPGATAGGFLCQEPYAFNLFSHALDLVTILSGLGVAALVLGMILSLAHPPDETDLDLRAFEQGRNQKTARRFLYLAGLMMSAGLFLTMSWMHWPFPLLKPAVVGIYSEVINATLFYWAVFYTLLIITGFAPVMFLAIRRSDRLALEAMQGRSVGAAAAGAPGPARTAPSVTRMDEWKAAHGLRISMTEAVQALVAAASPLLTAFAGSFAPV